MATDLTFAGFETWDDLLVYMDGSAAVIGEMMLPLLEPRVGRRARRCPRPRVRVPAHELPPGRRRGPGPRPGLPPPRRPRTLRRRSGGEARRRAVAGAHAVRDRAVPGALPIGRHRDRPVARRVGPVRPRRPNPVLTDPRPDRAQRLRRVHPSGPGHDMAQARGRRTGVARRRRLRRDRRPAGRRHGCRDVAPRPSAASPAGRARWTPGRPCRS